MSTIFPTQRDLESRRAQMFPVLTDEQVARVAAFGSMKTVEAGTILFEQGDRDVPFYVVLEGELEVVHPSCRKVEEPVTIHAAREFTGEVSLLAGRRSLVRGRAKTRLGAICVEQTRFRAMLETETDLSELVMR